MTLILFEQFVAARRERIAAKMAARWTATSVAVRNPDTDHSTHRAARECFMHARAGRARAVREPNPEVRDSYGPMEPE